MSPRPVPQLGNVTTWGNINPSLSLKTSTAQETTVLRLRAAMETKACEKLALRISLMRRNCVLLQEYERIITG